MKTKRSLVGAFVVLLAISPAQAGVMRDAKLATKFAGILQAVDRADADAPRMRGVHETQLFERVAPAVVLIFSLDERDHANGLGSGSVLNADGQILTNKHVVDGADRVAVVFKPGSGSVDVADIRRADMYTARVEKVDEVRDLAILRLESHPSSLSTVTLGSLEGLSVGADVHAIGHPEGATWSYTKGIVSQIRQNAEWSYSDSRTKHHATVIQTQTPINPGNSGGPLINDTMLLVGVNTYGRSDAQGMNYAVSVDDVKHFIAELVQQPARKPLTEATPLDSAPNRPPRTAEEPGDHSGINLIEQVAGDEGSGGTDGAGKAGGKSGRAGDCNPRFGKHERDKEQPAWRTEVDYDCSGQINSYLLVWDDSSRGQELHVDRNGDGKMDAVYFDVNRDGRSELADFDTRFDGRFDMRLRFNPQNGRVVQSMRLEK